MICTNLIEKQHGIDERSELRTNFKHVGGISALLCTDRCCSDSCPLESRHTKIQYLTWFGKLSTFTGEVNIIRDIEKGLQHT